MYWIFDGVGDDDTWRHVTVEAKHAASNLFVR